MKTEYRVGFYLDDIYQVYDDLSEEGGTLYQGRLADCEAWIRLHEDGYM